jgi:hypothetical protein
MFLSCRERDDLEVRRGSCRWKKSGCDDHRAIGYPSIQGVGDQQTANIDGFLRVYGSSLYIYIYQNGRFRGPVLNYLDMFHSSIWSTGSLAHWTDSSRSIRRENLLACLLRSCAFHPLCSSLLQLHFGEHYLQCLAFLFQLLQSGFVRRFVLSPLG